MTAKEISEQLDAMKRATKKACHSPATARRYLVDAGIIKDKRFIKPPVIETPYEKAWKEYKKTEAYRKLVEVLTNQSYTPKQPYVDNVISRAFGDGYWRKE